MRSCAIIPAYDAERTVSEVVRSILAVWPERDAIFVVDDGSIDGTATAAREAGARVLVHPQNRGKGKALRTGMEAARSAGFDVAVTVDADGQHPADEAVRLLAAASDPEAMVLGIRDLLAAGAPRANQISNQISNFFLSLFARRPLRDTQCGLRRYPIATTLGLAGQDDGYAFEAEIILRAIAAGVRIVELPIRVIYPPEGERVTHFDSVRDPARIVMRVLETLVVTRGMRRSSPEPRPTPTGEPVTRVGGAPSTPPGHRDGVTSPGGSARSVRSDATPP
jgi:glycosyltransferase involved in cell wall biosynthesis